MCASRDGGDARRGGCLEVVASARRLRADAVGRAPRSGRLSGTVVPCDGGRRAARPTGWQPERTIPFTTAALTARPSAAGSATSASRRERQAPAPHGRRLRARARARAGPPGACGACARSSLSTVRSFADIVHPLFEPPQRAAEPRRACGLADSENACCARPVELEQDAQRDDLAFCRRELVQRLLQRAGQAVAELLDERDVARIRLFAPAPRVSARNQSIATLRAILQSQVRGEPRRGSKRRQLRNAFSNVSAVRSSAAARSPVR